MGQGGSKPEDVAALAKTPDASYKPPLGPPNPCVLWGLSGSRKWVAPPPMPPADAAHCANRNPTTSAMWVLSSLVGSSNAVVFFDIRLGRYGDATPLGRVEIE